MIDPHDCRELLIADVALLRGLASSRDVAIALNKYWDARKQPDASMARELARLVRVAPADVEAIVAEADRLIAAARGDAHAALERHGGLTRSLCRVLGAQAAAPIGPPASPSGPGTPALRLLDHDRYTDFIVAGEGGMGIVYLALDTELNRLVAFKIVRPDAAGRGRSRVTPESPVQVTPPPQDTPGAQTFDELRARFLQEAWVTGGLEHPGVVPVYEMGQTQRGVPYYTMRFVRGQRTLAHAIAEARAGPIEGRLKLLENFLKVCDTVRYAHSRGVVHRDLKPDNIALGEFGEVVLLDWGLAKLAGTDDPMGGLWRRRVAELRESGQVETMVGGAMGTPGYMAPEAALGNLEEVDHQSDIYSLGAILFEILTGRVPIRNKQYVEYVRRLTTSDGTAAREIDPTVPQALSDLCARALARSKAQRLTRVSDLADSLRAWQVSSAIERETETQMAGSRTALAEALEQTGVASLRSLDRAAAGCAQVLASTPANRAAQALMKEIAHLRGTALVERDRALRRRFLKRAAVISLAGVTLLGGVLAAVFEGKRRQADRALVRADAALETATQAQRQAESAEKATKLALEREQQALAQAQMATKRAEQEAKEAAEAHARADAEAGRAGTAQGQELDARRALHSSTLSFFKELGRQALVDGQSERALLYLAHAFRSDPHDDLLRFMIRQAAAPLDAEISTSWGPPISPVSAWAPHAVSPDGLFYSTARDDGTAHIQDLKGGTADVVLRGSFLHVFSVRISPDGTVAATAGSDGSLFLWDRATGTQLRPFRGHRGGVWCAEFSRDGDRILSVSEDATLRIWDSETGASLFVLSDLPLLSGACAWSPDGRFVAAGSRDGSVGIWDAASGALKHKFAGVHAEMVEALAFSPDGALLASAGHDAFLALLDVGTGSVRTRLRDPEGHRTGPFAFDRSGERIALGTRIGGLRLYEVASGKLLISRQGHATSVESIAFDARSSRLVTCGHDGMARIWEAADGASVASYALGAQGIQASFALGDSAIVTSDAEGTIRVTRTHPRAAVATLHPDANTSWVAVRSSGDRVVFVNDQSIRSWTLEGRLGLAPLSLPPGDPLLRDLSPTGDRIMLGFKDGKVAVTPLHPPGAVTQIPFVANGLTDARFSPSGETIATGGEDGHLRLWNARTGRLHVERAMLSAGVRHLRFSPDESCLAAIAKDGNCHLWYPKNGNIRRIPMSRQIGQEGIAFDRTWSRAVTVQAAGGAEVWDIAREARVALLAPGTRLHTVFLSADGQRVVTIDTGQVGRCWDVERGTQIGEFRLGPARFIQGGFLGATRRFALATADGRVSVWDADSGNCLAVVAAHVGGMTAMAIDETGNVLATVGNDGTALVVAVGPETRTPAEIDGLLDRRSTVDLVDGQVRTRPSHASVARCGMTAEALFEAGELQAAAERFEAGRALAREMLRRDDPRGGWLKERLGTYCRRLGEVFERLGDEQKARAVYAACLGAGEWKDLVTAEEARRLAQHLHGLDLVASGDPRTPSDHLALAYALLRGGAAAKAAHAFEEALKEPQILRNLDAANLYNAACAAALASASTKAGTRETASLADLALGWLEQDLSLRLEALKRGLAASNSADADWGVARAWRAHFDRVQVGDPDLSSLRRLPRFADLMRSISERAPP